MKWNREIRADLLKGQRWCKGFGQSPHRQCGWPWVSYLQNAEQGNRSLRHDTAVLGWAVWGPHRSLLAHNSPSKHLLRSFHISVHNLSHSHALNYLNKYIHRYPGTQKSAGKLNSSFYAGFVESKVKLLFGKYWFHISRIYTTVLGGQLPNWHSMAPGRITECSWQLSPCAECSRSVQQPHCCWSQSFPRGFVCLFATRIKQILLVHFLMGKVSPWNDGYWIMSRLNMSISDPWN